MAGDYSGAFGYVDDLKLLTPNVQALYILTIICGLSMPLNMNLCIMGKKLSNDL